MSMINLQDGYDLGYSECDECGEWTRTGHSHEPVKRYLIRFRCMSCAIEWLGPPNARPCLACGATRIEMLENP